MIVKGTPGQLTHCLIEGANSSFFRDPDYTADFLMTYRTFTTARALAEALASACKVECQSRRISQPFLSHPYQFASNARLA